MNTDWVVAGADAVLVTWNYGKSTAVTCVSISRVGKRDVVVKEKRSGKERRVRLVNLQEHKADGWSPWTTELMQRSDPRAVAALQHTRAANIAARVGQIAREWHQDPTNESLPREIAACVADYMPDENAIPSVEVMEDVRQTYTEEGVRIWLRNWAHATPEKRAHLERVIQMDGNG